MEQGIEGEELESVMVGTDAVNAQYMINALDWMKENYGCVMGSITRELGVTDAQLEQPRNRYLEEAN